MEDKIILNSTELTGIVGKNEMNKLSLVVEENAWNDYRKKYDQASNLELLDFGCSWGYGSFQLKKQGYKVYSYEISKPRSNYAKTKLNIKIIDNWARLKTMTLCVR